MAAVKRGGILSALFRMSYEIAVPDVLYERELASYNGPALMQLGLKVLPIEEEGVRAAQQYLRRAPRISLIDGLSLVLAKELESGLLTGDAALRQLAGTEGVVCHGLLWVFDRLDEQRVMNPQELYVALHQISQHPRCRLPKAEVASRLSTYDQLRKRD